jgi:hypothetical protein
VLVRLRLERVSIGEGKDGKGRQRRSGEIFDDENSVSAASAWLLFRPSVGPWVGASGFR